LTIAIFVLFDPVGLVQKAQDSKRKSDLKDIQKALLQYYKDFGKFPSNPGNCLRNVNNCKIVRLDGTTVDWDRGEGFSPYLKTLPRDPSKNKTYIYYVKPDRQAYYLYASLDRGQDKETCNSGLACSSLAVNGLSPTACGRVCNYGLSSANVSP
jgi:type II secretory pathway pseudopilin PulG